MDAALRVLRRLRAAGFETYFAGGYVRDRLLGVPTTEVDIATAAPPDRIEALFPRTVAVGRAFGVILVLEGDFKFEVATFRSEGRYLDGRHPEKVTFSTPREDARRRDFTINGMFFDPVKSQLHDFVGGQADLHARVLRAIGEPTVRFQEDKLRLLRAVRIATRFELTIEPLTELAIKQMASELPVVSDERIAKELRELLVHPRRVRGVNLLADLGLAAAILLELLAMKGIPYGPPSAPRGDLWEHVMNVMDFIGPAPSFALALGTLLHDIGKPRTMVRTPEKLTFYHHEQIGAEIADAIALRLKLSNAERERIVWLVEKHQYLAEAPRMRLSKLKVILNHPGVHELLTLHRADALAAGRSTEHVEFCEKKLREWTPDDLDPPPFITGNDLKQLGAIPGPMYKKILDAVREAQLDGTIKTPQEALDFAKRFLEPRSGDRQ
jgi:poly(A) polymerase